MMELSSALLGSLLLGQILSSGPYLAPLTRSRSSSSAALSSTASSASSVVTSAAASGASSSRKALPVLNAPRPSAPTPVLPPQARSSSTGPRPAPTIQTPLARVREDTLGLVNAERALLGIAPLKRNALLEQAAQAHAEDMAARTYFAHVSPDGRSPADRIAATGYLNPPCADCSYSTAYAENIGKAQRTPSEIVRAWMRSDEHRTNILDGNLTETGFGYAGGLWVEVFGSVKMR